MQTPEMFLDHFFDHFNASNLQKIKANLKVLKGIQPEVQILSGPENCLLAENRWVRSAVNLDTKCLDWTMRNVFFLLNFSKNITNRDLSTLPLLELAGKLHFTARIYFRNLKILKKTYANLSDGQSISVQIDEIRKTYKRQILDLVEANVPMLKKKPIEEIIDGSADQENEHM